MDTRELSVELEAVTPLFLGGAEQQPEARAASFRGALRFWWRALAAETDLKRLHEREARIFGDTKHASNVRVDVEILGQPRTQTWDETDGANARRWPGLAYLGFPFRDNSRRSFTAGTRLRLTLRLRRGAGDEVLPQTCAALWLLLSLGGLGLRARRGFGNLTALNAPKLDGVPQLTVPAKAAEDVRMYLQQGLTDVRALEPLLPRTSTTARSIAYSVVRRGVTKVVVLDHLWQTWQAALEEVGERMAIFRKPLYPRMSDLQNGDAPGSAPERAAFGLPIPYFDKDVLQPGATSNEEAPDRRASPLLVSLIRVPAGQYAVVLTVFGSQTFLPMAADGTHPPLRTTKSGRTFPGRVTEQPLARFLTAWQTQPEKSSLSPRRLLGVDVP